MLIKDYKKYINLSKILNSTFGDSGTKGQTSGTQSLTFKLLDDGMIRCNFLMIVNFGSDNMLREMMARYRSEAKAMMKAGLERVADEYKVKFPDSAAVKFDALEDTENDEVEMLSYSMYGGPRRAYYRYGCLVEVD